MLVIGRAGQVVTPGILPLHVLGPRTNLRYCTALMDRVYAYAASLLGRPSWYPPSISGRLWPVSCKV